MKLLCSRLILIMVVLSCCSSGFALPKIAYAGMSAILPGSGELALGKSTRGTLMIATDLLAITSFMSTSTDMKNLRNSYKSYASLYAGANPEANDRYFQDLQNYLSSAEYNQYHEMMARNYYLIYMPNGVYDLEAYEAYVTENSYADSLAWKWQNAVHQKKYRGIRTSYQTARLNHNLSLGILILNRVISLIDVAFIKPEGRPPAMYFSLAEDSGLMLNYRLDF
ncbi:MAG TPA: hypothetical protein P5533_08100 [Candidatus Cloacimonadota bacterium]|nr:hypothetical protein [Candidatus Cloacimonadota bacterium]